MTDNLRSAKQALEAKLREVTQSGGWRDTIAIERNADPLDTTQRALEREMATRSLDRNATVFGSRAHLCPRPTIRDHRGGGRNGGDLFAGARQE